MTREEAQISLANLKRYMSSGGVVDRKANEALDMAIKALEEPQWIPCSETVDIPEEWVLACDEYGAEIIGYLSYTYDQWICESEHEIMYDPIAWMPLPESWDGGDSE